MGGIDNYGEDGEHNRMTPKSDGHGVACNLQRQRLGDTIGLGYALEHCISLVEAVAALTAAIYRGDPMCRFLGYAGTGQSFAVVRLLLSYVSPDRCGVEARIT